MRTRVTSCIPLGITAWVALCGTWVAGCATPARTASAPERISEPTRPAPPVDVVTPPAPEVVVPPAPDGSWLLEPWTAEDMTVQEHPLDVDGPRHVEVGLASYYGNEFRGRRTASGERYKPSEATCAHRTAPFGTRLLIISDATGKRAVCRVNDRGPHIDGRVIDVSKKTARDLGIVGHGISRVRVLAAD